MLDDWKLVTVGELIDESRPITYGVVQPGDHDPNGIPLVRGGDFSFGWRALEEYRRVSPEVERPFARARLKAGDLVITIKGDVGTAAIVPPYLDGANISQTNARIAVNARKALADIVLAFLQSHNGRQQIAAVTQVGAQPGLIFRDIQALKFLLPPLPEQRKIAEILRTWDEAIEACERLVEHKARSVDILAKKLLTDAKRGWRSIRLTDAITELTGRNTGRLGSELVMGVNKTLGMVPMKEHVKASDLSRYKSVPADAFAYNPMRLNIGSLARNTLGREVLVSPDYVAFQVRPNKMLPSYFDHLRHTLLWSLFVKDAGSGGVRVRIYFDDLEDFVFDLPSVEEQTAIVAVLDDARREISIHKQRRDALKKQKRGLMQKLLTGEWRVKVKKDLEHG